MRDFQHFHPSGRDIQVPSADEVRLLRLERDEIEIEAGTNGLSRESLPKSLSCAKNIFAWLASPISATISANVQINSNRDKNLKQNFHLCGYYLNDFCV